MLIRTLWRQVQAWLDARVAIDAVSRLDDRLLQDMGIPRDRLAETIIHGKPEDASSEPQTSVRWSRRGEPVCAVSVAKAVPACAAP